MQTLSPAKELRGKVALPPNVDLLPMIAAATIASRCPVALCSLPESAAVADRLLPFAQRLQGERSGDTLTLIPTGADHPVALTPANTYAAEFVLFTLLGARMAVRVTGVGAQRLETWRALAQRARCELEQQTDEQDGVVLTLHTSVDSVLPQTGIGLNEVHPLVGLALGAGWRIETTVNFTVSSPLRHLLPALGYPFEIRGVERRNDPLERRIQRMKGKSAKVAPRFTISADFLTRPTEAVEITLPGDEVLGAILLAAKTLVQRGNLVIENMPLESWATATLQLIRRMGCSPAIQETGKTTFGQIGMVQLQRFTPVGRRIEAGPLYQYARQLPAMVALALFAEGESVFRNLDPLHDMQPDAVRDILSFLDLLGAHRGEVLPDGIVLKGAAQYDGFDLAEPPEAHFAAAWCMVALKCIGESSIDDAGIRQRWPQFNELLQSIYVARTK